MKTRASFQFLSTTMTALALFGGLSLWILVSLFSTSKRDHKAYRALVHSANPINVKDEATPYTATQKRENVQKDVLFTQGQERLQLRVISAETEIIVDHQQEGTELIEKMHDVTCFMQQELYYVLPDGREAVKQPNGQLLVRQGDPKKPASWIAPDLKGLKPMQYIRALDAKQAIYHYKSDKLVAENVHIARYAVPGHALITSVKGLKPLGTALAKTVEFSLSGKEVNFKAHQLKATLYNAGSPL